MADEDTMPVDFKQYVEALAQEAGADDDTKQALLKLSANDKVAKRLSDDLMRHDEFSREMDKLRRVEDQHKTWYADQLKTADRNQQAVDNANAAVQKYVQLYGDLPPGTVLDTRGNLRETATGDVVTKKELKELMEQKDAQTIALLQGVGEITADYVTRFNKKPDFEAIKKIAIEKGLTLSKAYDEYISPEVDTRRKADTEAEIKRRVDEGIKEAMSRHQIPVDTAPRSPAPYFAASKITERPDGGKLSSSFVESWNTATAAK